MNLSGSAHGTSRCYQHFAGESGDKLHPAGADDCRPLALVVEGQAFMRHIFRAALEGAGCLVEEAGSGEEAIDLFQKQRPDLLVLDLVMPGMDGFKTCAALRCLDEGRHTPILVVTNLQDSASIRQAFEAGATDFVTQPVNGELLGYRARFLLRAGRALEDLARSAYYDTLTGLSNRALFTDYLQKALAQADRSESMVALLFLDLDHFKDINDTHGHEFGDKLLKKVARRLANCLRTVDTLARLGGDEFVVMLTAAGREAAGATAHRILETFRTPFDIDGRQIYANFSIGIALYPDDALDLEGLLRSADSAMYQAKALGRQNVQFLSA